jgi:hypothetical protein
MPKDLPTTESDIASDIVTLAPAATEVGALALITLDPAKYVAEVFKPFRAKFDAIKAEAELIHFRDDRLYDAPHRYVDISTVAGMDIAIKYRAAFRDDVRIAAEKTRVQRKAPMLAIGKLLDSEYKAIESDAAPFEALFDIAIREENSRKEAIKAAKERAEAERIAAIRAKITEIIGLPAKYASGNAEQLNGVLFHLANREVMEEEFSTLVTEARAAVDATATELIALRDAAVAREQTEADRLAELAAEKKRNAEQAEANRLAAIENEKIANAQAAESLRLANLAAAQEAEATRLREKAAANLAAELAGIAEQVRRTNEAQAEADAKLKAAQAAFEAQKAEFAAIIQCGVDHAEALEMNAALDAGIARIEPVETFTNAADLARCTATAQAMLTNGRSLVQPNVEAMQFSVATYADAGLDVAEAPVIDYEAIAWAYEMLTACGVANKGIGPARMMDRLSAMLLTKEVTE